ncbi:hypothetical protein RZS08_46595, partial [Arthrospira platensis SPKY1]|nr:hypothetical protein [Arthrospira platensis SPKY1]
KRHRFDRTYVNVLPLEEVAETATPKAAAPAKPKAVREEPVAKSISTPVEESPATPEAPAPEVKSEPKAGKSEKITLPSGKKVSQDDLKLVEGVGPKIEGLLNEAGIHTWADLANADLDKLQA